MSVFIERIKIKNLLSFDEEGIDFELKPLNVLIGANASGKSNFGLTLKILMSTAFDLQRELNELDGGPEEALWKGKINSTPGIEVFFCLKQDLMAKYKVDFDIIKNRLDILSEEIIIASNPNYLIQSIDDSHLHNPAIYHLQYPAYKQSAAYMTMKMGDHLKKRTGAFPEENIPIVREGKLEFVSDINFHDRSRSILQIAFHDTVSLLRDMMVTYWRDGYYQSFGATTLSRPNEAGVDSKRLALDGSNLASYVGELKYHQIFNQDILPKVQEIYPNITDVSTRPLGGRIALQIYEKNLKKAVLQSKVSQGVLRLIAALGVIYQPDPPFILCLEEPENGFHPDVIRVIAKALKEASERTQIIVTTHSPLLLSYLEPEDIVICEKPEGKGTQLTRATDKLDLTEWLKEYNLGDLWLKGVLGGTRY